MCELFTIQKIKNISNTIKESIKNNIKFTEKGIYFNYNKTVSEISQIPEKEIVEIIFARDIFMYEEWFDKWNKDNYFHDKRYSNRVLNWASDKIKSIKNFPYDKFDYGRFSDEFHATLINKLIESYIDMYEPTR